MASEARKAAWTKYNRSDKKKIATKKYYENHREKLNKGSTEWQRENRERVNQLSRARYATPEGRAIRQAIEKRYAEKNREKRIAKDSVNNAIRAGKLIKKPCEKCGASEVQGHHPDYSKPLEVIWLCKSCHELAHHSPTDRP